MNVRHFLGSITVIAAALVGCGDSTVTGTMGAPDGGFSFLCSDGEQFEPCGYVRCVDGTDVVSMRQTCFANRLVCQPVTFECPTPRNDGGVADSGGVRWPIRVAISAMTPPAQSLPRNSTGVYAAAYDVTDMGKSRPIRMVYLQRGGDGPATDIANVYYYAIPNASRASTPFRYSTGRAVKPVTNRISIPFDGNIRPGETSTMLIYIDLAPGTVGAQHAFEVTGVLVEDGSPDGLLVPITGVRSNPITISEDLAGRLDVRVDGPLAPVTANVPGEIISAQRLRANRHDLDVVRFSYVINGTVEEWREIMNLELWRGRVRVPITEWMDPINGHVVMSPLSPIRILADTEEGFTIHARVTAPAGRMIRILTFAEYPVDVYAIDRVLNVPAATCISSSHTVGCDGPGQGAFDGTPGSVSEAVVSP